MKGEDNLAKPLAVPRFCGVRVCEACLSAPIKAKTDPVAIRPKANQALLDHPCAHSIRVAVIAAEHRLRMVMDRVFNHTEEFHCCGIFSSCREALINLIDIEIHVLVVEMVLPDCCGIKCAREMANQRPGMKTILVTSFRDPTFIRHSLMAGIDHCLISPLQFSQCLATLRFISYSAFVPVGGVSESSRERRVLNPREELVLSCLARGLLHKEIEANLSVGHAVLKKLLHRIFSKLHVHNRMEAVNRWYEIRRTRD